VINKPEVIQLLVKRFFFVRWRTIVVVFAVIVAEYEEDGRVRQILCEGLLDYFVGVHQLFVGLIVAKTSRLRVLRETVDDVITVEGNKVDIRVLTDKGLE
jgi:hypothetical protein